MSPVFGFTGYGLFKINTHFYIALHQLDKSSVVKADTNLFTLFRDEKTLPLFS